MHFTRYISDDQVGGWIQVTFEQTTLVTGVITQGRGPGDNGDEWVESYTIQYGVDESNLQSVSNESGNATVSN